MRCSCCSARAQKHSRSSASVPGARPCRMPLIKLGYLLVRTVSRPVANLLLRHSKASAPFRAVCIRFAQACHRSEVRLTRALNRKSSTTSTTSTSSTAVQPPPPIRPLDEQRAIDTGANFLAEALLFLLTGGILLLDSAQSSRTERARRHAIEQRFLLLEQQIAALHEAVK